MKNVFAFLLIIPFIFSCTDNIEQENILITKSSLNSDFFNLKITYQGKTYSVPCELKNDSLFYLDPDFKSLYENEIENNPTIITFCNADGSITFYTSKQELLKKNNYRNIPETKQPKISTGVVGTVTLWDDVDYNDRSKTYNASLYKFADCDQLRNDGDFNDKTSALKVFYKDTDPEYCAVFTGYENDNFQGRSLVCVANNSNTPYELPNLKRIPCGNKGNWNDRITSFTFEILLDDGTHTSGSKE